MKPRLKIERPKSDFPELIVTVPDSWPYIILEPFYDVHIGNNLHATKQFERDVERVSKQKYTLTWNGGDLIENNVIGSPEVFSQNGPPHEQFDLAMDIVKPLLKKMLFAISGNHEARTWRTAGVDLAKLLADKMKLDYFGDYCFLTICWRGNKFRGVVHHGSGASATPGGQRNAARKDSHWTVADFYWTGHLHQSMVDVLFQQDYNQRSGRIFSRQSIVVINPSYVKYYGGYAAAKRLGPGTLGTVPVVLYEDGSMHATIKAKGRRL